MIWMFILGAVFGAVVAVIAMALCRMGDDKRGD